MVPKAGQSLSFEAIGEFLRARRVAAQYIPERLIVREAMPATPSGKIQKFRLRETLRQGQV